MTDQHPGSGEAHYDLVMPFIACQSNGGPYDDDAYAAGWELGRMAEELERAQENDWRSIIATTIHSANVAQADLLAMRHGFHVTVESQDDEWASVYFHPRRGYSQPDNEEQAS